MAYENGKRINRHARNMRHKAYQKRLHMRQWPYYDVDFEVFCSLQHEKNAIRPYPIDDMYFRNYWRTFYLSGPRQYAKDLTDTMSRAKRRELTKLRNLSLAEIEEMDLERFDMTRQIEQCLVDYAYTVW